MPGIGDYHAPLQIALSPAGTPGTAAAVTSGNASAVRSADADESRDVLVLHNVSDTVQKVNAGTSASEKGLTTSVYTYRLPADEPLLIEGQLAEKAWWAICGAASKDIVVQEFTH